MKKTVQEWFAELPADIEARAIANTNIYALRTRCESLATALILAFSWDKTPEGRSFWDEVYHGNYGEMGAPKPAGIKAHFEKVDGHTPIICLHDNRKCVELRQYGEVGQGPYLLESDIVDFLKRHEPKKEWTDADRLQFMEDRKIGVSFVKDLSGAFQYVELYTYTQSGTYTLVGRKEGLQTLSEALDYVLDMENTEIGQSDERK